MESKIIDLSKYNRVPKFVAVEGPVGVGKTTLTKLLAESFGYETFLEQPSDNPFLGDFYNSLFGEKLFCKLFSISSLFF